MIWCASLSPIQTSSHYRLQSFPCFSSSPAYGLGKPGRWGCLDMWHTGDAPDCHRSNKGSQPLWICSIICASSKYRILSWGPSPSLYVFESEMCFDERHSGFRHLSITFISFIQRTVYIPVPPHGHASRILPKSRHLWKRSIIRDSLKQFQGSDWQNQEESKTIYGGEDKKRWSKPERVSFRKSVQNRRQRKTRVSWLLLTILKQTLTQNKMSKFI